MALFLTILEGDSPEKAKPLIATRDPELIRLVTAELARRLEPLSPVPTSGTYKTTFHRQAATSLKGGMDG